MSPIASAPTSRGVAELRGSVRAFIAGANARGEVSPAVDGWFFGFSPEFSQAMGERGWVGMTWPREHGGGGRSPLERLIVVEELLAAGVPMNAHWVADRQTGPSLLRFGSDAHRRAFLPRIARGELYFALGMSEPASGSDLASVQTTATRVEGGWVISGTKIWTGNAHRAHFIVVLCRSSDSEDRTRALSQFIVDLTAPGLTVRPITTLMGRPHFCEVTFDEVFVGEDMLLGDEGSGWAQVVEELAMERGGPERFLSTFPLFARTIEVLREDVDRSQSRELGALVSRLIALRFWAAALLTTGEDPRQHAARAAAFKGAATQFETELTETLRRVIDLNGLADDRIRSLLREATLAAPAASLRGGTTEIMYGIVAKGLP